MGDVTSKPLACSRRPKERERRRHAYESLGKVHLARGMMFSGAKKQRFAKRYKVTALWRFKGRCSVFWTEKAARRYAAFKRKPRCSRQKRPLNTPPRPLGSTFRLLREKNSACRAPTPFFAKNMQRSERAALCIDRFGVVLEEGPDHQPQTLVVSDVIPDPVDEYEQLVFDAH